MVHDVFAVPTASALFCDCRPQLITLRNFHYVRKNTSNMTPYIDRRTCEIPKKSFGSAQLDTAVASFVLLCTTVVAAAAAGCYPFFRSDNSNNNNEPSGAYPTIYINFCKSNAMVFNTMFWIQTRLPMFDQQTSNTSCNVCTVHVNTLVCVVVHKQNSNC